MARGLLDVSDLLNPAPRGQERDPEAGDPLALEGPALEDRDDSLLASAREATSKGKRMMADIVMDNPAYAGRRTTRKAHSEWSDDEEDGEDGGEEEGEEEASSSSEVESADEGDEGDSSEDDEASSDEEGEEVREAKSSAASASVSAPVSAPAKRKATDDLEAAFFGEEEDAADAARAVAERAARDARRAAAVRHQRSLWDAVLEARITMSRALAAAARLPRGAQLAAARTLSPEVAAKIDGAADATRGALADLVGLGGELLARGRDSSALGAGVPAADVRDAPTDALWNALDEQIEETTPFVAAAVDRWQRKALLTGASTSHASFKAFNQSVSSQMQSLLTDLPRLVERSRLVLGEVVPLGHPPPAVPAEASDELDGAQRRDVETYDDREFYSTLLKEFLEFAGANGGANAAQTAPKKRRAVDRRASKGRKIRYNVNEKLVNFMSPEDDGTSELTEHLFRNLFGGTAA